MTTKLAIIIPAYNCQATIGETLSSLQSLSSGWEHIDRVIVCDDASSDGTVSKIKSSVFDRCPLVLLRHKQKKGEAGCYSTMISTLPANVEWFLILHADDLALDCFIDRNVEIASQCTNDVAAVSSNYYVFDRNSEELAHGPAEDVIIFRGGSEAEISHTARIGSWWHISGSLVNRTLWEKFGGRDPSMPQMGDWDLVLRWQSRNYLVGHSLVPTTKYRKTSVGSVSSQSYLEFRDLQEKVRVILNHPNIFRTSLRLSLAGVVVRQAVRRIVKLIVTGQLRNALRGIGTTARCILELLLGTQALKDSFTHAIHR